MNEIMVRLRPFVIQGRDVERVNSETLSELQSLLYTVRETGFDVKKSAGRWGIEAPGDVSIGVPSKVLEAMIAEIHLQRSFYSTVYSGAKQMSVEG